LEPSEGFNYYRGDVYWNNFDLVNAHHNRLVSGRDHVGWREYVHSRYGRAPSALFVHCGNGWVERDFFRDGIIDIAVGTDISDDLLNQARASAAELGMPAQYYQADTNTFDFTQIQVDWIVNHAAFHHIAWIDRAVRAFAQVLQPSGLLIGYDYTGPHRNQYPWADWAEMIRVNHALPARFQADLRYPHMPTMLATDPTEAVHSELILEVCRRYFSFLELRPLGGAIAYQLLYQNQALHAEQDSLEGRRVIAELIERDQEYTANDPTKSYFNFWVAQPKSNVLQNTAQLEVWSREEREREEKALSNGHRYGAVEPLELLTNQLSDARDQLKSQ
jgi:SAM-dependent methyltransferase